MSIVSILSKIAGVQELPPVIKEPHKMDHPETEKTLYPTEPEHWIYQVWSRVVDGQVWFVYCQQEAQKLKQRGITEPIFTQNELRVLIDLSPLTPNTMKFICRAKELFDGELVEKTIDEIKN